MKKLSASRKKLVGNSITYLMIIAAYAIIQILNAGGLVSPPFRVS